MVTRMKKMAKPNRASVIKKATSDHWMEHAVKKPGSFTKIAKAAGKTVHEEAETKKHAKGKVGEKARFALIAEKIHKHRKGGK
jgi:hypothetical protein